MKNSKLEKLKKALDNKMITPETKKKIQKEIEKLEGVSTSSERTVKATFSKKIAGSSEPVDATLGVYNSGELKGKSFVSGTWVGTTKTFDTHREAKKYYSDLIESYNKKDRSFKNPKGLKSVLKDSGAVKDDGKVEGILENLKKKKASRKTATKKQAKKVLKVLKEVKAIDWKEKALKELKKKVDSKDLTKASYGETDDKFEVKGDGEYVVFKTFDDAEREAEDQVENDLNDEPGIFNADFLNDHLYVSDTDKRIIAGEESDRVVDDMDDEDVLSRMNVQNEYDKTEDEDEKEKILDKAKDDLKEEIYDEWYKGLDKDPIGFLVGDQSLYSREDALKQSFIQIDIREAAKAAVNEDGVAHFLGRYDGNQIDLPCGAVAFRTN